jgi:3-deoxy-D-manno-octulosonic-acid transferase
VGESVRLAALRATAGVAADLVRGRAHPRWRTFLAETWGRPRRVGRGRPVIWLVAPAGGEVVQTTSFCPALREAFPEATLILSTGNHAFLDVAQRIPGLDAGLYTPWDLPAPVTGALDALVPDAIVAVEAAWCPVLLGEARRRGVATMLASGTMVAGYHEAEPYRRPMRLRVLDHLDVVGVKNAEEISAFAALGVAEDRLRVLGDLRLDPAFHNVDPTQRAQLARWLGLAADDRLLVAGSLHLGEESVVLDAFTTVRAADARIRLLIAPRYLGAVPAFEAACAARGLESARLSRGRPEGGSRSPVLVLDTYGDLARVYAAATWVLLGGSLVEIGLGLGQNLVEPLLQGVPVFFGPHMRRWRAATQELVDVFPGLCVRTGDDLARGIQRLDRMPEVAEALRRRTAALVASGGDSVARHVDAVAMLLRREVARR